MLKYGNKLKNNRHIKGFLVGVICLSLAVISVFFIRSIDTVEPVKVAVEEKKNDNNFIDVDKLFAKYDDVKQIYDNRPAKFYAPEVKMFTEAINKNHPSNNLFIRDYALISDKIGYLILFVENPVLLPFPKDKTSTTTSTNLVDYHNPSCDNDAYGQQLEGDYYLGLVRENKLMNSVPLPKSPDTPNRPSFRKFNSQNNTLFEPSVLDLEDLNGDGLKYEVRFPVGYISCGNDVYSIGGYDTKSDKATIYPIITKDENSLMYARISPNPDGTIYFSSGCDHGSEFEWWKLFKFTPSKGAYVVQKESGKKSCEADNSNEYHAWMGDGITN